MLREEFSTSRPVGTQSTDESVEVVEVSEEFFTNVDNYPFQNIKSSENILPSTSSSVPEVHFSSLDQMQPSSSAPAPCQSTKKTTKSVHEKSSEPPRKKAKLEKNELLHSLSTLTDNLSRHFSSKKSESSGFEMGEGLCRTIQEVLNDKEYPLSDRKALMASLLFEVAKFMREH